jgi:DNA helicase IV
MYGDVNQLVYTYKGITDWDELNDIVTLKLYFLNENYRNTVQITNYCNKVFDAEIVAIGINGDEVKKLMLKNAIADIQKHHSLNPESRIAIIYKKGHEDLAKKATDLLLSQEYIIDSVDNSKISVITVEMAKGLEFERVVVLTEDMSINEKYISYTRALESLIVT